MSCEYADKVIKWVSDYLSNGGEVKDDGTVTVTLGETWDSKNYAIIYDDYEVIIRQGKWSLIYDDGSLLKRNIGFKTTFFQRRQMKRIWKQVNDDYIKNRVDDNKKLADDFFGDK